MVIPIRSTLALNVLWQYITFLFQLYFWMRIFETRVVGDQGINWIPNLPNCSPLLNSFQQFISFVIFFLVSGIIMGFKEWNLNKALYYGSFNFITSFHFQYFASNPIIFGYNNISMIFLVSNQCCSLFDSIFIPFIFIILSNLSWFVVFPAPRPLKHSNSCFAFYCISLFVAFLFFSLQFVRCW
jgi:hypothetical protein